MTRQDDTMTINTFKSEDSMRTKRMNISKASGWRARVGRALIFTMLFGVFIYQGLVSPKAAEAAITTLSSWASVTNHITTSVTNTMPYTVPAGTARMLVVAVNSTISLASAAQTVTVTYGGQTLTAAGSNFATSARDHTALFYLQEAGLQAAGANTNLSVKFSATNTQWITQVDAAVFDFVDQSGSPITNSQSWLNDGTAAAAIGPFATALTIGTNDLAVEIVSLQRYGTTPARTMTTWAANWTQAFGPTAGTNGTNVNNLYISQDTTPGTTTSNHTAGTTNASMSAMSIKPLIMNLLVGNGTNPQNTNAGIGTVNNPLDSVAMSASAGVVTVNSIVLTGTANFSAANIGGVSVYLDSAPTGTLDASDVLVPSSYVLSGSTATITFSTPISIPTTTQNFLVTVDVIAGTAGNSFTGTITSATGAIGTPVYNDSGSATLTFQAAPGLTVGNSTNPLNADAQMTSQNNALDGFTLVTANALGGTAAIDTLTVKGNANFTSTNISGVHVYLDSAPVGTFDVGDTLASSTATVVSGNTATLTFSPPIYVTNTPASYLVVVDIAAGATVASTVTGTVTGVTGHGLATPTLGDANSATLTIKPKTSITSCADCHGYSSTFSDGTGTRNTPAGAFVGDHNAHVVKAKYVCSRCHVTPATETAADFSHQTGTITMQPLIVGGTYTKGSSFAQVNNPTTTGCLNIGCHGGNNPTPQWGVGTAGCIQCHSGVVRAFNAETVSGGTVTSRDSITSEFGAGWGHKKLGRGAVTDSDCIVCHLEGSFFTQKTSAVHGDGYINLRNPDGVGEVNITNMSGATYSFIAFSTAYTSGSRTSNANVNTVDNILTQKFCLACHDSNGATNTTAVTSYTTGTLAKQYMPFGGIFLGVNYNLVNGASTTGGLINTAASFSTSNSSYHPVVGSLNRDFPAASRLQAPYNNNGLRSGVSGSKTLSVVLNCFDCHNAPTTPLLNRTVASHGSTTTNHLRGNIYVTTAPVLCTVCHTADYATNGGATVHGAGSAFASTLYNHNATTFALCNNCHLSTTATATRPIRAQDIHGFNRLNTGTASDVLWPAGATESWRPYGFLRNTVQFPAATTAPRPFRGTESALTSGTANCGTGTGVVCDTGSAMTNYAPGGSY